MNTEMPNQPTRAGAPPAWLPSAGLVIWLAFFLGLCLSDWRFVLVNADADPALHWRLGKWMLEHRTILSADQFSHTRFAAPLISKEWLGEVVYASAGNLLGWNGFVVLAAALIATCLWGLHRQLRAENAEPVTATALVLLAALAMSHHWLARPHLFSHLFALGFAWQLRWFDRDRLPASRLFGSLPLLMVVWTNLHGAFLTGLVLIGGYLLGALLDRAWRRAGLLAALLVVCAVASLVNPNTWQLHAQILGFLHSTVVGTYANEFRSPNFHSTAMRGFVLLILLLVFTLVLTRSRPRWRTSDLVLIGGWGFLALSAVRHVPIWTLVVVPILTEHLGGIVNDRFAAGRWASLRRWSSRLRPPPRASGWIGAVSVVAAVAAVIGLGRAGVVTTGLLANRYPVAAVRFLQEHPDQIQGGMFNAYGWGGYLLWAWPEQQVFVDGRNDFYGDGLMREFQRVDKVRPGWETVLGTYDVGWTLLPPPHPLHALLALDPEHWHRVYADDVAVVYARRSPSTATTAP